MTPQVLDPPQPQPVPAPAPPATIQRRGWTAGPTIALIAACLLGLASFGAVVGGGVVLWADSTQRVDGFITSPDYDLSTSGYALVTDGFEVHAEGPDWVLPRSLIGDARVRITSDSGPVFVGVARTSDVDRYLGDVSHAVIPDLARADGRDLDTTTGGPPATRPADQDFWIAASSGRASESLVWPVSNGSWTVVVMNEDASKGMFVEGDVGAEAPVLQPLGVGLLVAGVLLGVIAIALVVGAVASSRRKTGVTV